MTALRIAVELDAGAGIEQVDRQARAYEAAGVDVLVVREAYGLDAVSLLGYLAAACPGPELMSGILPLYSRTPAMLAMTAAGLDAVSGGRFSLGIGVSGPQVVEGWHGVPYDAPLGRTRETIEICRQVWRREPLHHEGRHYPLPRPAADGTPRRPLKLAHRPVRSGIPVYVAALGPRNVELAVAEAEGWIPFLYVPERADRVWKEPVAAGLARRHADRGPLQVVAGGPMAIGPDVTHLRELDRDHLALYVGGMGPRDGNFYAQLVSDYGWGDEARKVQDLYLGGERSAAAAAVPAQLLEGTSLIGDGAYVRDRLQAFVASGVTVLQVSPAGPDPVGDLRRLKEIIASL